MEYQNPQYIKIALIDYSRFILHSLKKCEMCWRSINRNAISEAEWLPKKSIHIKSKN